jgi:hypothetical protein
MVKKTISRYYPFKTEMLCIFESSCSYCRMYVLFVNLTHTKLHLFEVKLRCGIAEATDLKGFYVHLNELERHQTLYVGFSFSWPVNRICGILFNRFYRLEIHSLMVCIFDPACELLPPWTKELHGTSVLLPLYCTFSLISSPLPPFPMYSICRQCVTVWGVRGCWNVLWTIFCRSFTLCFWPDSEPTKLLHNPKQKWPVKTTLRDWCL